MNNNYGKKLSLKKTIGSCLVTLVSFTLSIGVVVILVNWIQELIVSWIIVYFPWLLEIAAWSFLFIQTIIFIATGISIALIPVFLILLIFVRNKNAVVQIGVLCAALVILANTWASSIITTTNLAGVLWLVIGLWFRGIGVVPIAFFAALFRAQWLEALVILLGCIIGCVLIWFSSSLLVQTHTGNI